MADIVTVIVIFTRQFVDDNSSWPHEQQSTEESLMVQDDYSIVSSHLIYGPHMKLSRGEELNNYARVVKLIRSEKIICSLDLILKVFENRCQQPGCTSATTVKHHTVGTTVWCHISAKIQVSYSQHYSLYSQHYSSHSQHYSSHSQHYSLYSQHYSLYSQHYSSYSQHCISYSQHYSSYSQHYSSYSRHYSSYSEH